MEKKLRIILEAKARQARRELRRFGGSVDQLRSGFDKAQRSSGKVRQYQRLGRDLDGLTKKAARNTRIVRRSSNAWRSHSHQLVNTSQRVNRLGDEYKKVDRQMQKVSRRQKRMAGFGRAGRDIRNSFGGIKSAATGLMMGGAAAKVVSSDMARFRLSTVINTETPDYASDEKKALAKQKAMKLAIAKSRAMAQKGSASLKDAYNIQYALNSAGLNAAEAMAGAPTVGKVSIITGGSAETVGEVQATVFNNIGQQLKGNNEERFKRIGELLTRTQFKFQIRDFGQLGESMKFGTQAMSSWNVELAQGLTLIGQLNSAGLQGSQAGTAFSAMLRQLPKAQKDFKIDLVRDSKGQLDLLATLEQIDEATMFMGQNEKAAALQNTFGDEGARGLIPLLQKIKELRAAQDDVRESSKGIIDKNFKEYLKTSGAQLKILSENIGVATVKLGEHFLPLLNSTAIKISNLVDQIGNWSAANPGMVKGIAAVGLSLVALKAASVVLKPLMGLAKGGLGLGRFAHGASKAVYQKVRGRGKAGGRGISRRSGSSGVLSTIFGAKVMPVEVINWPGGFGQDGGFDMGGRDKKGRRKKNRKPARTRFGRRGKASKLGRLANVFSAAKSRSAGMIQNAAGLAPKIAPTASKAASAAGKVASRAVPAVVATTATLAPKVLGTVTNAAGRAGKVAVNAAPAVAATLAPVTNMVKKAGEASMAAVKAAPAVAKATTNAAAKTAANLAGGAGKVVTSAAPAAAALAPKAMPGLAKTASNAGKLATKAVPAAAKVATKATSKTAAKAAGKIAAKSVGKSIVKKIPILSLFAGGWFAIDRALDGDWAGAGMELASGFAATLPVGGTIASVGIDAALMARDISRANRAGTAGESPAAVGRTDAAARGQASAGDSPAVPIPKLGQATLNSAWRAKQNAAMPDSATPPPLKPAIKPSIQPAMPQPVQPARLDQAAMNAAWRAKQTMGMDASQQGKKLVSTFDAGIKSQAKKPASIVGRILSEIRSWLPFSDAKVGPLSQLTTSGRSLVTTFGAGIASAGPGPLIAPLAAHFAAVQKQLSHQHLLAGAPVISPLEGSGPLPAAGTEKAQSIQKTLAELSRLTTPGPADGATIQVTYSPTIKAPGADQKGIEKALAADKRELERLIERTLNRVYGKQQKLSMGNVGV